MAKFKICKLHFTSPLHIGDSSSSYDVSLKTIQSDTIYAAITSCLAKLGEKLPNDGDLGFSVSSLFPFYQESKETKPICFLPKPLKQRLPKLENLSDAKKIKKVAWLDAEYAGKWYAGESLFEKKEDIAHIKGQFLTKDEIDDKFMSSQVSHRVTVSRTGKEDAKPFYMDRVYFKGYSGLYFIYDGDDKLLKKGLDLLRYEGLGTDRNVGNGLFEYELDTIDVSLPSQSDYSMSLSVFIPEDKNQLDTMLSGEEVSYDFMRRGGWITTPPDTTKRKNFVYAFTSGSVFSLKSNGLTTNGKIVDLKPSIVEHSVYRSGKSLFIPIKLEKDGGNKGNK